MDEVFLSKLFQLVAARFWFLLILLLNVSSFIRPGFLSRLQHSAVRNPAMVQLVTKGFCTIFSSGDPGKILTFESSVSYWLSFEMTSW